MRTSYIFDHPSPCPECGKAAAKKTETLRRLPDEPYTGNMQVLRKERYGYFGREAVNLTLWDGESYIQKYGYFCSLNCTSAYANKMVKTFRGY